MTVLDIFLNDQNKLAEEQEYISIFKKLGGYFGRSNILIGGSYAYSKALELQWNKKDIDVFILIPRMETWALLDILNLIFDSVVSFEYLFFLDQQKAIKNKNEYYKIDKQWKRVICSKNGVMYDLIFVDNSAYDLVYQNTGSDISRLYYELTYNTSSLKLYAPGVLEDLKRGCRIDKKSCTDAYYNKIINLCKQLDIKVGYI